MRIHRDVDRGPALVTAGLLAAGLCAGGWQMRPAGQARALDLTVGDHVLSIQPCTDRIIRVSVARDRAFAGRRSLAAGDRRCAAVSWTTRDVGPEVSLDTGAIQVRIDRQSGRVRFLDRMGTTVLAERDRALEPATVQGEQTFHVRQRWQSADEALYGLGQHQLGLVDIKGYDLDLWQHNATVAIPVLVSSRGWGVLWDNTSYTRFGELGEPAFIPASQLFDAEGRAGGLTGRYYAGARFERLVATRVDPRIDVELIGVTEANRRIHPDLPPGGDISVRWEGSIEAAETGDHTFVTYSGAGIRLWIDDRLVIDHWRQGWLPWTDVARVRFERGRRHRVRLEWSKDQGNETMRLRWRTPVADAATSLWSEVGDGIDYYFIHGPEIDAVVAGYRRLTGEAPMMPRWAFGLWQSRERYKTAQESLDVLREYRTRKLPIDVIVQDWQYWKTDQWGSHAFDPARFPDPAGWARAIHDTYRARLMMSVWGKFYPGTAHFDALKAGGHLYESPLTEKLRDWLGFPYTFYDAFSAPARQLFWQQLETTLLPIGVDAWWMDATEPDIVQPMPTLERQRELMQSTAMGSSSRVLNAYSLVNSQAVYEGQRRAVPDRRALILTRSGFAGQQRYASATWSGDVTTTWPAFRAQIAAGLGFSISGLPYWTTDSGGFAVPPWFARSPQAPDAAEEWRELNVRWFQFATFCPLTRLHGQFPFREVWHLAPDSHPAYQALARFLRLRYRMLPYVYSLAGAVTREAGTILRPLVMDFRQDRQALDRRDSFMFGPALLVSPITEYRARSRSVYLPRGTGWYDFWTGAWLDGGQTIEADAPYDRVPVHVRAGSIVPFGADLQYTDERPADPVTLYVFAGANGAFALYEDDGQSYGYEGGAFSTIPIRWDEASRVLTIGARQGRYPGMLAERTFEVVFVSKTRPAGVLTPSPGRQVRYTGAAATVQP